MRITAISMKALVALLAASSCYSVGYLFYKHPLPAGCISILGVLAVPAFESFMQERRNRELSGHFRQFLYAFSTSLSAGRSVENAMISAELDLKTLFASDKNAMVRALSVINGKVANGMPADKAFADFSDHTGIADIHHFNEVFLICKHSGGDMVELIKKTAHLIAEKIEIEQEIQVITAQKSFEAKAMAVVPLAMIAFLAFGSPDYMAPLYEGIGRVIMTVVLTVLCLCYVWMRLIMRIKV